MIKHLSYFFSTQAKVKLKSPEALASPQIPNKLYKLIYFRPSALTLIQEMDLYLSSEQHTKQFKTDLIMFQYSSFCLHYWLLKNRLELEPWYLTKPFLVRRSLSRLAGEFTKDHIYLYDDIFNLQVFYELKRIQQTIHWALDDYFKYGFRQKPLEQIINEDICIEENEEIEGKLEQYILKHMEYLKGLTFDQLMNQHIDWGLEKIRAKFQNQAQSYTETKVKQQNQTST